MKVFITKLSKFRQKWPNTTIFENILQSITVSKKLKFLELELHDKLKFHKIEFQKGGTLLNILQIVVDSYIFSQTEVYDHFGPKFMLKKKIDIHSNHISAQWFFIFQYLYFVLLHFFIKCLIKYGEMLYPQHFHNKS